MKNTKNIGRIGRLGNPSLKGGWENSSCNGCNHWKPYNSAPDRLLLLLDLD